LKTDVKKKKLKLNKHKGYFSIFAEQRLNSFFIFISPVVWVATLAEWCRDGQTDNYQVYRTYL